jgi:hypothetical protein
MERQTDSPMTSENRTVTSPFRKTPRRYLLLVLIVTILIFLINIKTYMTKIEFLTWDTNSQRNSDEITLPDGTKQFAYGFISSYPKVGNGDYAEWAIYYPANYSASDIISEDTADGKSELDVVDINRASCCVKISVKLSPYLTDITNYLDSYRANITTGFPLGTNDQFWYKKDLGSNQIEVGRIVKRDVPASGHTYDNWYYAVSVTTDNATFTNDKAEIIGILDSFETGFKNLRSSKFEK